MFTKNKKSLSALLALLLLLCTASIALAVPKQAPPPKAQQEQGLEAARVVDEADILTADEEKALDTKLAAVEQSHKVRILVGTMKDTGGAALGKVANNVVDQIPGENGTIVLLLSMKERDWYISTDNKMRTRITDGKAVDYLAGEFLPDLKEGKYAAAFTAFGTFVADACVGHGVTSLCLCNVCPFVQGAPTTASGPPPPLQQGRLGRTSELPAAAAVAAVAVGAADIGAGGGFLLFFGLARDGGVEEVILVLRELEAVVVQVGIRLRCLPPSSLFDVIYRRRISSSLSGA